ncbi:ATP-binding cassette domain-containing protein [Methylocaldum szegediense]|nr:ATP-binding cassette domain-containing protein [Methylocaldum szegediense]
MKTFPRRFLVPEVVQTSLMDCGPAALKSLLEGFGIRVSYGRLREACQTDVDGTSIDTLEELAKFLGLDAEQVMLPPDHLLIPEAGALPAIVTVCLPSGLPHFVVAWRRHGGWVQLMDPASGRCWQTRKYFLRNLYIHRMNVSAADWAEWARSDDFLIPLNRRLRELGLENTASALSAEAAETPGWQSLAALDAATRLTASLVRGKGLKPGREAYAVLEDVWHRAASSPEEALRFIPEAYWSVRPAPPEDETEEEEILLKGAVLIRVKGHLAERPAAESEDEETSAPLNIELAAARAEAPPRPLRELLELMHGDGWLSFTALGGGLLLTALGFVLEALLLRGVLDLGHDLQLMPQRLAASGYLLLFVLALLWLELHVTDGLLRLGRRLETRLRIAVLERIPRLPDQYFRSRPVSDMAERSHVVHRLGRLPQLGGQLLRAVMTLIITGAAIAWLYPAGAPIAALSVVLGVGLPLAFNGSIEELELRARTHNGSLIRFYLDTLLGLSAIRSHGAEASIRREQEDLMVAWGDARVQLFRVQWLAEGLQAAAGFGLAVWLLFDYAASVSDPAGALLLAYWALHIPALGEEIALLARQYPMHRNLALRLIEPLRAPVEWDATPTVQPPEASLPGVEIVLENVTVHAGGQTLLHAIDLHIPSGSHVAIVGPSGAGKSSLVGLLLGWHRAAEGEVRIDGELLDAARIDLLRRYLVWIDPAVRLWNRSLLDNLFYGAQPGADLSWTLGAAELLGIVERLPDGFQTLLGEGGGRLSGGEGQRVRVGRGLLRSNPRLVILDEPFRGLERPLRRTLLERTHAHWRDTTLLCITHDVGETLGFERVLVVDGGHIVEDGAPAELAENPESLYRALLDAETSVHEEIWGDPRWRRLRVEDGKVQERRIPEAEKAAAFPVGWGRDVAGFTEN